MYSQQDDRLFRLDDLYSVLQSEEQKMHSEIDAIDDNRLLNSSVDDLCDFYEAKYRIDPPRLKESEISVSQPTDKKIEVRNRELYGFIEDGRPVFVSGTTFQLFIPFEGDKQLFRCRPSNSTGAPRAKVGDAELVITYTRTDHDAASVKRELDRDVANIRANLEWIARDSANFNNSLREKIRAHIDRRREKVLKDKGLVASLGFPLRHNQNATQTFVASAVRRKPPIPKPQASTTPFVPEPALDMNEYEHILSVICNMVMVMERSPQAFRTMNEEALRQHFLVQLNGHYEGQATGETFNIEGKTDILIRTGGRNIFVAECKLWRGEKYLREALDQLLGYATWRDTKTALLVFNRTKSLSAVLAKIPEVVTSHPHFKRKLEYKSETGFRYTLHHRDDVNREIILTVLVFEVPK